MNSESKDRWIGAIPYFPSTSRLWIRGSAGSMKPNAARPLGLLIWVAIAVFIAGLLGVIGWAAFG